MRDGLGHRVAILGHAEVANITTFLSSGTFEAQWALRFDTLSAVMVMTVTVVSTLIHVYACGYMSHDDSQPRFMSYLSLFTFAMLMLVTADNLVQMFFGWEGVGLASYLLIGFWYQKPSANAAAMKAFVVNRVGDFGFALGIFLVFQLTQSLSFNEVFASIPGLEGKIIHVFGMDVTALALAAFLVAGAQVQALAADALLRRALVLQKSGTTQCSPPTAPPCSL